MVILKVLTKLQSNYTAQLVQSNFRKNNRVDLSFCKMLINNYCFNINVAQVSLPLKLFTY